MSLMLSSREARLIRTNAGMLEICDDNSPIGDDVLDLSPSAFHQSSVFVYRFSLGYEIA